MSDDLDIQSRRPESDYTAWEREQRDPPDHCETSCVPYALHPSFVPPRTPCPECGSVEHGDCGEFPSLKEITAAKIRGTRWSG